MKVAIFGKEYNDQQQEYLQLLVDELTKQQVGLVFFKPYFDLLKDRICFPTAPQTFSVHTDLLQGIDMLISIGGDGTFLDTVPYVRASGIPILGLNLGRLGFLSSISIDEIESSVLSILKGDYTLEKRALLQMDKPEGAFGDLNFALNDLTIYRNTATSLIVVHVYINGLFLNSYWGDGLIISTPTGSTAYSMSVGGPIVSPGSQNFVIAPIASHNLTVRPIVIQDSCEIKIKIEGREEKYQMTLDSRHSNINKGDEIIIRRCDFDVYLVQMKNQDFYATIRDKLLWGVDSRN